MSPTLRPPTLQVRSQAGNGDELVVLLPGAAMTADELAAGLFPAAAARRHAPDLCAVALDTAAIGSACGSGDAANDNGGHPAERLAAVHEEILAPARAAYRRVWLGGISLGGLLALCLAADRPQAADALCLLAPYPGSRLTTKAIARAGGLDAWQPSPAELTDPEFRAWQWLKSPALPAFVGYGADDRFAAGMRQLAERFPADTRHTVAGGHDWPAWQRVWDVFLDHLDRCEGDRPMTAASVREPLPATARAAA